MSRPNESYAAIWKTNVFIDPSPEEDGSKCPKIGMDLGADE